MFKKTIFHFIVLLGCFQAVSLSPLSGDTREGTTPDSSLTIDPAELVVKAIDHWRGSTSSVVARMTVHRPDWEREMKLVSLTSGTTKSLVRFLEPPKDAGSASLTLDNSMWSYAPKINRVIKIPPSMMSQSWMGSDFSYKDLARSDDIIEYYDHTLLRTEMIAKMKVYVVQSIPHDSAPVVWGKEVLQIREDYIILQHDFYDQDMKLLKQLQASQIEPMGGRMYPKVIRMKKMDEDAHWTEIVHVKVKFDIPLSTNLFTLSSLRNPRSIKD